MSQQFIFKSKSTRDRMLLDVTKIKHNNNDEEFFRMHCYFKLSKIDDVTLHENNELLKKVLSKLKEINPDTIEFETNNTYIRKTVNCNITKNDDTCIITCQSVSGFEQLYRSNLMTMINKKNIYIPKYSQPHHIKDCGYGWITVLNNRDEYNKKYKKIKNNYFDLLNS